MHLSPNMESMQTPVPYDSTQDTKAHIALVGKNLEVMYSKLMERAPLHDQSKLEAPEKEFYDKVTPMLKGLTYGSKEYKENLKAIKPAIDHHYANNRHHPEHFENGLKGMTLVDLVEMFCDWMASVKRHEDGDMHKSVDINKERFGYDEVLTSIFHNTVDLLQNPNDQKFMK